MNQVFLTACIWGARAEWLRPQSSWEHSADAPNCLLMGTGLCFAGVVGGVVGLAIVAAALAAWLVMRKRRIRNSGSSDEESPHMKGGGYGVAKRFPNGAQLNKY